MKDWYSGDEIVDLFDRAANLEIDIDALPNETTLHELHKMVDDLEQEEHHVER